MTRRSLKGSSHCAKRCLLLVLMMVAGVQVLPVTFSPPAGAETVWRHTSPGDFNATGAVFKDCGLNGTGDDASVVLRTAPDWILKDPQTPPLARAFAAMTAIDTDDRVVLFGGTDFITNMDDTWVYDLGDNLWTEMKPSQSPPGRQYCQLATVFNDDKAVLFGGMYRDSGSAPIYLNDTWVYDLSANTWYNRTPAVSPPPNMAYAMATVFGTDTVVLFTGTTDYDNYTAIRETWTYDVSDNQWTRRNHSVAPPSRLGAGMAAVWNDDKVVLFGGYNRSAGHLSDTWIYDLSDNQWYQRGPPEEPSARWFTALATIYDDDKVLLFGGTTNDTQVYDLSDNLWTDLGPVHDPDIHEGSSLATVARTSKTVLFGGYFTFLYQTTWVFEQCAYMRSGEYRSPPVFAGGPAQFLTLKWTAALPAHTTIELQVRTADTALNLGARNFTGPDGQTNSVYTGESAIWSAPGDCWLQYRAVLSTGKAYATPALEEVRITSDRFPEAPELLGPPDGLWVNTTSPAFGWRFNDTDTEAQGMFDWQLDRSPVFSPTAYRSGEVCSAGTNYTYERPLPEGLLYWRVRTADTHGWGPFSEVRTLGVDITPPSAFSPFVDPAGWTAGRMDLIFLTDDSGSGMRNFTVFIDNKPWGERESPWTLPELPDGTRSIVVRATDRAGNWVEGRTKALVDRTPPAAFTPAAEPAGWTKAMPQITFSTQDNASGVGQYEVRVDSGRFIVRSSPFTPPELDDGEHDITVRAVDRAGNAVEGSVKIFIDRSRPDPLGVGVEPPGWTALDQTVTFWTQDSTSGVDRYEASVDGGPFAVRTSPFNLTGLKDGEHTVTVRAYDRGGNYVEGQARAFTDRTPPDPFTISAEPAAWTRQAPTLTFQAGDNHTAAPVYRASVDNGTFSKVNSPWSPGGLGDGAHLVRIRAYDEPGNFAEATVTVFMDTRPPERAVLAINNGSRTTRSTEVRLAVAADDAGSGPDRMCFSNDGVRFSDWAPFSRSADWTLSPGAGTKTVFLKIRDQAGNEATASANIEYAPASTVAFPLAAAGGVAVALAIALAISAFFLRRLRKKGAPRP